MATQYDYYRTPNDKTVWRSEVILCHMSYQRSLIALYDVEKIH